MRDTARDLAFFRATVAMTIPGQSLSGIVLTKRSFL